MRGRIDRMDVCEDGEKVYVKIIDYKSGSTSFDLLALYYGLQLQLVVYMDAVTEMAQNHYPGKEIVPAGILYYNIADPLAEKKGNPDPEQIDAEILKKLRMNGLVNSELEAVRHLDRTIEKESDVIPVVLKDGEVQAGRSSVANRERFARLSQFVHRKLKEAGQEILDGEIGVEPYKNGQRTACDYCPYHAVCGFDRKTSGYEFNRWKNRKTRGNLGGNMQRAAVNWTREQSRVIESRGKNLLVSAAAGSGKTAVLVERIIRMVTEGENPPGIDELLVMTFTNAAAAEMRERIAAAIEQKLKEDPQNEHLQMQATLVHHAQITTIDSFCLNVIREHFNQLDLDPAFRIGDEGELLLMRADVMAELLEDSYASGDSRFEQFVETFAQGKTDAGIEDYIMQVYSFSQSNPYPHQWIADCRRELADEQSGPWMEFLLQDLKRQAAELRVQMEDARDTCRDDAFLCAYESAFSEDVFLLKRLSEAEDFSAFMRFLQDPGSAAWPRCAAKRWTRKRRLM